MLRTHRFALPSRPRANGWLLTVAAGTAAVAVLQLLQPVHIDNAATRSAIETVSTICALVGAALLFVRFEHTQRTRDLLLLGALVTAALVDFPSSVLPALIGMRSVELTSDAVTASQALVAIAFAAAALTPAGRIAGGRKRMVTLAGFAAMSAVAVVELVELLALPGHHAHPAASGLAAAAGHPWKLATYASCAVILGFAAAAFVRRGEHRGNEPHMLAGAALLLGGAQVQYLALPVAGADWITPGTGLRLAAYGLLLSAAIKHHARMRKDIAEAALLAERERIARDLHDGIAQDLAFIAAHSTRLASDLGEEHPLTIAAKRALAASRGTIVDLAASSAPSTAAALEQIAKELSHRFDVQIDVRTAVGDDRCELDGRERDEIVRIAREAIVNAVKHGAARHVTVELGAKRGDVLLLVRDDGSGIVEQGPVVTRGSGFGLPTMRARAESLGAKLRARPALRGGTEVEVSWL